MIGSHTSPLRLAYLGIGTHIHTQRWLTSFVRRGHDVHLLTVHPGAIEGVTQHDIRGGFGPKIARYAVGLARVRRALARLEPDLLHAHFLTGYGYWGAFSGFHPSVLTVWGDDVYVTPFETRLKLWLARKALRTFDWVTGDSRDILEACQRLGAAGERMRLVPWGVDFRRFHPGVETRMRQELGIGRDAPVMLSTRSFTKSYYNIEVIADATSAILARHPEAVFVFAGYEGSDQPIQERLRRLGVEPACRFLGRVDHAKLPAVLAAADVFVSVPSVDATAVSLLEAMAMGMAIVTSALPSALEWIQHDVSGLVVPPGERAALVEAVCDLFDAPDRRHRLGAAAVAVARERADHERNMDQVEEIYQRLTERARA